MSYELVVTRPFGSHLVGTIIRDAEQVRDVLAHDLHQRNVVKRFAQAEPVKTEQPKGDADAQFEHDHDD